MAMKKKAASPSAKATVKKYANADGKNIAKLEKASMKSKKPTTKITNSI